MLWSIKGKQLWYSQTPFTTKQCTRYTTKLRECCWIKTFKPCQNSLVMLYVSSVMQLFWACLRFKGLCEKRICIKNNYTKSWICLVYLFFVVLKNVNYLSYLLNIWESTREKSTNNNGTRQTTQCTGYYKHTVYKCNSVFIKQQIINWFYLLSFHRDKLVVRDFADAPSKVCQKG